MRWLFLNKEFKEPPQDLYGFVYLLVYKNKETNEQKYYIGKKNFWFYYERKALKDNKKRDNHICFKKRRKNGKLEIYELFKKESDWKTYVGSYKGNLDDLELIEKQILDFAKTKRHLTYLETKMLFKFEVLENNNFLNENILGKFYKGNII